jgi:drug/metabolite transporter (DMT)-like permease
MSWIAWSFLAFFLMGLANVGMKGASVRGLSAAGVLFWVVVGELPLAVGAWMLQGRPMGPGPGVVWGVGAGVATGLALLCLNASFAKGAPAALAVAIMNANFLLVALLGVFVFKEGLSPAKLGGLALALAGLWLMSRP